MRNAKIISSIFIFLILNSLVLPLPVSAQTNDSTTDSSSADNLACGDDNISWELERSFEPPPTHENSGLANAPWPKFRRDPLNTGRSPYIGAQKNVLRWSYVIGGKIRSSPAVGADGTIYVGSTNGTLYAINSNGTLKWAFSTGGAVYSSPAIDSHGTVYVGSYDGKVYAINPDGTLKWSYQTIASVYSSPAIDPSNIIYIAASYDANGYGRMYALYPNGTPKWVFKPTTGGSWIYASPTVRDDGTIMFGDYSNPNAIFWALKPDGTVLWTCTLPRPDGEIDISSTAAADPITGNIYFGGGNSNRKIFALSSNGTILWSYLTGGLVESSPAIGTDGTVYVGSMDGKLYALRSDGTLKWSYQTGRGIYSSPAVGADGTVYVGSYDGKLYALNSNGTLKWAYATGGSIASSPAIGADGTVYIGSEDGKLYAIGGSIVDTLPPVSSVNPIEPYWQVEAPFTVTATASDDLSGVALVELFYRYSYDNSTWGPWVSFGVDANVADGWSWQFTAPDGYGYYEFYSVATDRSSNVEAIPSEGDARCIVLISDLPTNQDKEEWKRFITWENVLRIVIEKAIDGILDALRDRGYIDLYLFLWLIDHVLVPAPELPLGILPTVIIHPLKPIPISPTQEILPQPSPNLPPVLPPPINPAPVTSGTVIVEATAVSSLTIFLFVKIWFGCDVEIIAYDPAGIGHPLERIPETEMWILDEIPIQHGVWTFEIRVTDIPANAVFWAYVVQAGVPATVNVDPDTLNLKSKGKWVTCHIELPEPFDVHDVDISTIALETKKGVVFASAAPTDIGDFDNDGIEELMVKFDRQALIKIVDVGDSPVVVSGKTGGVPFIGQTLVRIR